MARVVVLHWKEKNESSFEVFSNLKILCHKYPVFNYNTLSNYLSKNKIPYENHRVRIERTPVQSENIPGRKMAMVINRVKKIHHDEERQNYDYWMNRPPEERLEAVTRLIALQKKTPDERMDKSYFQKEKRSKKPF